MSHLSQFNEIPSFWTFASLANSIYYLDVTTKYVSTASKEKAVGSHCSARHLQFPKGGKQVLVHRNLRPLFTFLP